MEVGKSNSKRSCFPQTPYLGEESHLSQDSELEYLSAHEEYADDKNSTSEFSEQREVGKAKDIPVIRDEVPPQITAGHGEVSGKSDGHIHSVSVEQEGPLLSPGKRAPAVSPGMLHSRGINTEITMMNKSRPVGLPQHTCADSASNTEWSFGAQRSHVQEQWESKNQLCTPRDWNLNTDRPGHLDKQTVKDCVSRHCQKTLQRATEAELQLLAVHYKMCYQHCLSAHKLALEANTCFERGDEKAELDSSLLLALEELENNYSYMRMEINMGTPLNVLPPLSVEVKFPPISSFYVPYKVLRKCLCSDDLSCEEKAGFGASELQEKETCVTEDKPQSDDGQPGDCVSPQPGEEQCKDQALKPGYMKTEEETGLWFDAEEDLAFSVTPEEMKKPQDKQGTADLREGKTVERESEHSSVRVGGLSSSASEDSGDNPLQKTSVGFSVNSSDVFQSPYALNLSSFGKLVKRLQARHPEARRDKIFEAILQVRENNKGVLCGLSISTIEERASAILRKPML